MTIYSFTLSNFISDKRKETVMLYSKIFSPRYKNALRIISLTVLSAFIFTVNSCMTYSTQDFTPQQFGKLEEPEKEVLLKLTTKDSVISADKYPIGYSKTQSAFIVEKTDTLIAVKTNPVVYKKIMSLSKVSLNDVLKISTEKSEFDMGKTLKWTGITIGSLLVIGLILLIIFPPQMNLFGLKFN